MTQREVASVRKLLEYGCPSELAVWLAHGMQGHEEGTAVLCGQADWTIGTVREPAPPGVDTQETYRLENVMETTKRIVARAAAQMKILADAERDRGESGPAQPFPPQS